MSTHNLCFEQNPEKYQNFLSENFHFLVVKFSVYLKRHVFVMHGIFWRKIQVLELKRLDGPKTFVGQILIVLGFNDTSTLEGHFLSSPREREKRDRRESRGDEREGQGRKRNRNESEETEEIKTFPLYPYPLQG